MDDPGRSTSYSSTPAYVETEVPQLSDVPSWFLNNCVKTWEELSSSEIPLRVYDSLSAKDDSSGTKAEDTDHYEIPTVIYESLFELVSPAEDSKDGARKFVYDAMEVRMPHKRHGHRFLEVAIQHFAKDIRADMITIGSHDFENLAAHFATEAGHSLPKGVATFTHLYFAPVTCFRELTASVDNDVDPAAGRREKPTFPLETIIASLDRKDPTFTADRREGKRPIIVLLTDFHEYTYGSPKNVLGHLRDYLKDARSQGREIVVIAVDNHNDPGPRYPRRYSSSYAYEWHYPPTSHDDQSLSSLGCNPMKTYPVLVPKKSDAQQKLLEKDHKKTTQERVIRRLQSSIKEQRTVRSFSERLEPYADWKISEDSLPAKRLKAGDLKDCELQILVSALKNTDLGVDDLERAFERLEIIDEWMTGMHVEKKSPGRWDNLHEGARKAIKEIKDDDEKYKYENKLLDSIVSSDAIDQSWDDMVVDDETKDAVKQLVNLASSDPEFQYGILSKSRIRGALLYGPPGTGKTQLARVLAHEYKAVMIHVSSADIESKWIGETEKQIKGLFNLASLVAPSIIFIDEADALFRRRRADDHSWSRSRLNEFLNQQDGLTAAKMPPFLLLATNHPNGLDDAVMRRVPARIYIGLPGSLARESIFGIFLRGETTDQGLNIQHLAARTAGYTGSDIKTICTQAALICQNELDKADRSGETRVLTEKHFDAALSRTGPTVSHGAVHQIRDFAEKFDPTALQKMNRVDIAGGNALQGTRHVGEYLEGTS
ncbi:AAA-domain-containing protein [Hypoxylon sp. FL1150]|nr:AAA-domain-containing protein [Hypoxylon sp. FL1150]